MAYEHKYYYWVLITTNTGAVLGHKLCSSKKEAESVAVDIKHYEYEKDKIKRKITKIYI